MNQEQGITVNTELGYNSKIDRLENVGNLLYDVEIKADADMDEHNRNKNKKEALIRDILCTMRTKFS